MKFIDIIYKKVDQVDLRLVSIEQTMTLTLIYVLHLTVYYIVVISKVRKISITVKSSVRMDKSSFKQISMISCIERDWIKYENLSKNSYGYL